MPTTDLEDRVLEREKLYIDLPEMINPRFSSLEARADRADTQLAMLTRDVRVFRAAVTRQLIAVHQDLRSMKETLKEHSTASADLRGQQAETNARLNKMEGLLEMLVAALPGNTDPGRTCHSNDYLHTARPGHGAPH